MPRQNFRATFQPSILALFTSSKENDSISTPYSTQGGLKPALRVAAGRQGRHMTLRLCTCACVLRPLCVRQQATVSVVRRVKTRPTNRHSCRAGLDPPYEFDRSYRLRVKKPCELDNFFSVNLYRLRSYTSIDLIPKKTWLFSSLHPNYQGCHSKVVNRRKPCCDTNPDLV